MTGAVPPPETRSSRWLLIAFVVAGGVIVFAASAVLALLVGFGTCGGDGGSPNSARDSPAGAFCGGPLEGPWYAAMLVVPAAVLVGLGLWAVARGSAARVAAALLAGVAALVLVFAPVGALPRDCSDEDQEAYERWIDGGRRGPQPADCETYS